MEKKTFTSLLAALTFLIAAVALQLYFNGDYYFAMCRAKCSFTFIVLIAAVLTALSRPIERIWRKQEKQRMTLLDWCVLAFGCSSVVTCLLSRDPGLTFVGAKGMFVGAFTYLTGMLVYFTVSRNMIPQKWTTGIFLAGWSVIFLWTFLNQCGVDFFGMHVNIKEGDTYKHVSSMGNNNSASDAFATLIAFILILMVLYKKYILSVICFLALMAAYTLGSEGVFIGLLTMTPFVISVVLSRKNGVGAALNILLLAGLSLAMFHFLRVCNVVKVSSGLVDTLSGYWTGEIVTVVSVILLVLYHRGRLRVTDKSVRIVRKVLVWTCVAVLVGFVAFSVFKSSYDGYYGTKRGAIWKGSVWAFRLYNPLEMIFGQGSGMFADNVTLAYSMLLDVEPDFTYATCHNSLLQVLLGNGIIGLCCLLPGLFSLIRDWFRDLLPVVQRPESQTGNVDYNEIIRIASFVAIMGYFGSSLVESTYPHTVILLFAMLALYRSSFFVPRHTRK